MEIVRKAATAEVAGWDFVLSDATVDRYGDVVEAAGWEWRDFLGNPIALFNHDSHAPIGKWKDIRIEKGALRGRLEMAAAGTSARIDELRSLIEQGILRAVSVGFHPIESEALQKGRRFLRQALVECSLVSVPANPNALAIARSLHISDETLTLAFGEHAGRGPGLVVRGATGEHAAIPTPIRKTKMTLSERIVDAQNTLVAKYDRLRELNGEDALDLDAINDLNDQIEKGEGELAVMKRSDANAAARAGGLPAVTQKVAAPAVQRLPYGLVRKEVDPFDRWVRRAVVNIQSILQPNKSVDEILASRYPDDEPTAMITKAAVLGASTSVPAWAGDLVQTATQGFMENLTPLSVYPPLAAAGTKATFGPNSGAIKIPSRASTPSISGSFVGEASPIPVRKLGLTSKTLTPHKMGVISVFSREIAKYSNPSIEGIIRQAILEDTAITIDTLLLDAVIGSAIRPQGLTYNVSALTATAVTAGSEYNAVIGDIKKLYAPFAAANRGTNLRLLMNPAQAISLSMYPGPLGTGFGWSDQFTNRFSPIISTSIPVGDIFLIDADDFITATGDTPEFDLSEEALLHMEDTTPLNIVTGVQGAGVVAAPSASMFQTAQIAIRMQMEITWNTRRAGAIQWIDNVLW